MRVIDCSNFNSEFPESYNWELIDSPRLILVARELVSYIAATPPTGDRGNVPGLRAALRAIAWHADIF